MAGPVDAAMGEAHVVGRMMEINNLPWRRRSGQRILEPFSLSVSGIVGGVVWVARVVLPAIGVIAAACAGVVAGRVIVQAGSANRAFIAVEPKELHRSADERVVAFIA